MAKFTKPCLIPVPCQSVLCFPGVSALLARGQFLTCWNLSVCLSALLNLSLCSWSHLFVLSMGRQQAGRPHSTLLCWQVLYHSCLDSYRGEQVVCSPCKYLCWCWWKKHLLLLGGDFSSIPMSVVQPIAEAFSKESVQPKGPCGWALSSPFEWPEIHPNRIV